MPNLLLALALMARLVSCGFELNSVTDGMEAAAEGVSGAGLSISTTTKRTGTYALKASGALGCFYPFRFVSTAANGPYYARFYLNNEAFPTTTNKIAGFQATSGSLPSIWVTLDSSGILTLADEDGTIGSAATPLSLGTWPRIEMEVDLSGAGSTDIIGLYVEGVQVARATNRNISVTLNCFAVGKNMVAEGDTTGILYFDDVAVNDNSGTKQNTFPGDGAICYLRANADGDAATGAPTRGGADSGANWSQLNEVTPNDVTNYMVLPVNPSDVWVNLEAGSVGGILAGATITLVEVNGRVSAVSATASNWLPQIKSASGGTIAAGGAVTWASASWFTNDDTLGTQQCKLVQYVDPTAAGNWTPALIDSMQISGKTTDGNPDTNLSTLWAIVEFVNPAGAQVAYQPQYLRAPVMAQ